VQEDPRNVSEITRDLITLHLDIVHMIEYSDEVHAESQHRSYIPRLLVHFGMNLIEFPGWELWKVAAVSIV